MIFKGFYLSVRRKNKGREKEKKGLYGCRIILFLFVILDKLFSLVFGYFV